MLKGHVFSLQTFTSEAFALFIDKFLNGRCGVAKGCAISNTTNSVTIGEGYFVIKGRLLQIISEEMIYDISTDGYYSLICEIDLSKTNSVDEFKQAKIKTVYNLSNYPELAQEDITGSGAIYQYEFARFEVDNGSITNLIDRRTYVDFESVYDAIEDEAQIVLNEIRQELNNVLDESIYLLKEDASKEYQTKISIGTEIPESLNDGEIYLQYFE